MMSVRHLPTITARECLNTLERRVLRMNGLKIDGRQKYLHIPDYVPDEAILTGVSLNRVNWARETQTRRISPEARPVCLCGGFLDLNANAPNGVGNRCRDHYGKHESGEIPYPQFSGQWAIRNNVSTTFEASLSNDNQDGKTVILGEAQKVRASKKGDHSGGLWETFGLFHLATVRQVSKKVSGYRFQDRSMKWHTTHSPQLGYTVFTIGMKSNGVSGIIPVHPVYADSLRVSGLRFSTNPDELINA